MQKLQHFTSEDIRAIREESDILHEIVNGGDRATVLVLSERIRLKLNQLIAIKAARGCPRYLFWLRALTSRLANQTGDERDFKKAIALARKIGVLDGNSKSILVGLKWLRNHAAHCPRAFTLDLEPYRKKIADLVQRLGSASDFYRMACLPDELPEPTDSFAGLGLLVIHALDRGRETLKHQDRNIACPVVDFRAFAKTLTPEHFGLRLVSDE